MREEPKDKTRLLHISEAIDNLFEFTQGITFEEYKSNKILRFAVIKNLGIIGKPLIYLRKNLEQIIPILNGMQLSVCVMYWYMGIIKLRMKSYGLPYKQTYDHLKKKIKLYCQEK